MQLYQFLENYLLKEFLIFLYDLLDLCHLIMRSEYKQIPFRKTFIKRDRGCWRERWKRLWWDGTEEILQEKFKKIKGHVWVSVLTWQKQGQRGMWGIMNSAGINYFFFFYLVSFNLFGSDFHTCPLFILTRNSMMSKYNVYACNMQMSPHSLFFKYIIFR